ncbi:amidohydrolase family protein [Nocardioides luteus]|uniref:Amidohydrolase n=1 Tax=Nocardioides luteus TaxID=1844 RepID=A0A1J4NBI1_9ACTN|nr:amidohydrolase family protein [Nocardioides luteus]OIJ27992.1 amidohydrolase [Nocardioides luteus]
MITRDGKNYFIVDGHIHIWDGSDENCLNDYGKGWTQCFFDYHNGLSPEEEKWSKERFAKIEKADVVKDVLDNGGVDVAIFNPTVLSAFYKTGFRREKEALELVEENPGRFILNTSWDPRFGEEGLELLEKEASERKIQGVKLYTAEWQGDSRGYSLTDPMAYRYLEKSQELGIKNIHIHKGPTVWPLDRDAFDVHDVDHVATDFQDLNFIVEHIGLPRLEDFCWIATQERNVYAGMAVAMPFVHAKPRYFEQIMGELLYWLGEDKICFGSDYAIWTPRWLVERFLDFQFSEGSEYDAITDDQKAKVLGLNAARLYDIEVPEGVVGGAEVDALVEVVA